MTETLEKYLERNIYASPILTINVLEEYGISLNVTCTLNNANTLGRDKTTYICLFVNNEYVGNSIFLRAPVGRDDAIEIAKEMISEFKNKCDLSILEDIKNRICPCGRMPSVPDNGCEECEFYVDNNKKLSQSCMGQTYSYPTHFNGWEIETKWEKKYGEGSILQKEFALECIKSDIEYFVRLVNDDKEYKNKAMKIIKKVLKINRGWK